MLKQNSPQISQLLSFLTCGHYFKVIESFFFRKWLLMYIKRPQKKFQHMFKKNDLVIPVKNVLVNEKKQVFSKL